MDFKYRVSVIVPVYNVEEYLEGCLNSLVNQTISDGEMEIIVVNDGSTDGSFEICKRFEEKYSSIKLYSKENEGLSATRNYGIKRAQGKYLMFIDSDDYFALDTVKSVADFFDTVYDKVDLVTYYEQPYGTGCMLTPHFRFKYFLKNSGVYNLEKFPYILQTRINVCVKNLGEDNYLFDATPGFRQEDQEYNNRVLMPKMKIGYCSRGCYYYNKSNENSIVATTFNSINLFEQSTAYLERLFATFEDEVPRYFQAICFHDLKWKMESGILFPYHYGEEEFDKAVSRIKALLRRIDNSIIVNYPKISEETMVYWLMFKDNANVIPYVRKRKIILLSEGKIVYKRTKLRFKILAFQSLDNGNLLCRGYIETPLFSFVKEKPTLFVHEDEKNEKQLETYPSKYGYLNNNEKVLDYYAFEYEINPNKIRSFRFYVKFDGFEIVSDYSFAMKAVLNAKRKMFDYATGNVLINMRNSVFYCSKISKAKRDELERAHAYGYYSSDDNLNLKLKAIEYRKSHRVWLYSDLYTVEKDNAYYQFINDFSKQDGVERYYVYTKPLKEIEYLFTEEQKKYLVEFGSKQHKLLFLSSELILSAFYGRAPVSPFEKEWEENEFYEIEQFKVIYLQHGVLHASLFVQNSAENARADKIVISSEFEKQNLIKNYNYREDMLIPSSMARYDHIDRSAAPKGRILFAPSWRNYFAENTSAASWETNIDGVKKSEYFKNISKFLENEALAKALEKSGIILEVKLHPIIADAASSLFKFKTDNIIMAQKNVCITDYDMFVTDFSSFVFDYACLSRPVLYFVPDYLQFKSGMGHYRNLDLPFEEAFGKFVTEPEAAAEIVISEIESSFSVEEKYKERMDNFFYPLDNCADRLYDYINSNMLPSIRGEL